MHICVCVKTSFYVGVCLINCESMWETVCLFIWVRAGEIEQNEEVEEQICFQPLSSSQSAPSHKPLYVSFGRREGDGQRERERETDKETQKINMFKWWMNTRGGEKERDSIRQP